MRADATSQNQLTLYSLPCLPCKEGEFLSVESIPEAMAKEWVSIAFIRSLIAQVGLNVQKAGEWDDGWDILIGSNKLVWADVKKIQTWISVQVKAITNYVVCDGHLSYDLDAKTFRRLRKESGMPQYLVVYILPKLRKKWLVIQRDHHDLVGQAFWFDVKAVPATTNRSSRNIKIPLSNRLCAVTLHDWVHNAVRTHFGAEK